MKNVFALLFKETANVFNKGKEKRMIDAIRTSKVNMKIALITEQLQLYNQQKRKNAFIELSISIPLQMKYVVQFLHLAFTPKNSC